MNFWINGDARNIANEQRVFAECANDGQGDPFFSISATGGGDTYTHFFLRDSADATDPNGVSCIQMADGTYQLPAPGYYWIQDDNFTTNSVLDGNWHMFTMTIGTNGDIHVYVDGNYDAGGQVGVIQRQ